MTTVRMPPASPLRSAVSLVQWGAVWAGAVVAVGVMALLTSLWVAIGYGSGQTWVSGYVNWWIGGSAIVSMFVGGFLAGWLGRARGVTEGLVNGVTVWALLVIAGALFALPGTVIARVSSSILWTTFWAALVGLGAAFFGGVTGGVAPHATVDLEAPRTAVEGGSATDNAFDPGPPAYTRR